MAALATMCVGCQEEMSTDNTVGGENSFIATFESNVNRVYLGDDDYCRWEIGDKVSFFNEKGDHYTYSSTKGDVTTTELTTEDTPDFSGEKIYAIFPYAEINALNGSVLSSRIAEEQVYDDDKVGLNNAIMVSHIPATAEKYLSFKNSCALVKVELNTVSNYAGKVSIDKIQISSATKNLAGNVKVNGNCVAEVVNGVRTITLTDCAEAGPLTEEYKSFVLVIPAGSYDAGDLTITIDASDDRFDYVVVLNKDFTVNRSEYVTLHTTLTAGTDRTVNKAIMADIKNLTAQGFSGVEHLEVEMELPNSDFTLNGEGRVYDFKTAKKEGVDGDIYIMNTFTTTQSGIKDVTPPTVTVNDITITGTLRGTSMGIWVSNGVTNLGTDGTQTHPVDAKAFKTIFNNVKIVNNNIIPWTEQESAGLAIFGEATLNNCSVKGTRYSEVYKEATQTLYDVTVRNGAVATFNGGDYDFVHGKEQSKIVVDGGVKIDLLVSNAISTSNLGYLKVNNVDIREAVVNSVGYSPNFTVSSEAKIGTLRFANVKSYATVVIDDNAAIGEIYVEDTRYATIAEFKQGVGIANN